MENSLKQRIIGAIVLAALAIIFLPAILKDKASNGPFVSQIPDQPQELREYVVDKDKINQLVADKDKIKNELKQQVKAAESASLSNQPIATGPLGGEEDQLGDQNSDKRKSKTGNNAEQQSAESIAKEKPSKNFIDSAWVVQVASFAKELNAINLVKKLKSHKFKAYRRKVTANGAQVFRVFVGPYIEQKDATIAVNDISKVSETEAVIRPFDPINH